MKLIPFIACLVFLVGCGNKADRERQAKLAKLDAESKAQKEEYVKERKAIGEQRKAFFAENGPIIKILSVYQGDRGYTVIGESEKTKNRIVVPYWRPETFVGDTWFPQPGDVVEIELKSNDDGVYYFVIAGPGKAVK